MTVNPELELHLRLSVAQGRLSRFNDKTEHLEPNEPYLPHVVDALQASIEATDLTPGQFIQQICQNMHDFEMGHSMRQMGVVSYVYDGVDSPDRAWHELQILQNLHNRGYHPDVFSGSKRYKFNHYKDHLASTVGKVADSLLQGEPAEQRLKHYLNIGIFGVMLIGEGGVELPNNQSSPSEWDI